MALPKIDVPRYPVTIPSSGEEYIMRPYLVKEEKVLLLALESQDSEQITLAIRNLITSCIEGDLNIDTLASFDIEKLFLDLRAISVGDEIALTSKCQAEGCEEENQVGLKTSDVKLTDYNPDDKIIKLTDSVGVTMSYPTAELLSKMDAKNLESVAGLMDLIIGCVATIFDEENIYDANKESNEEVKDFIEGLTSEQFQKLSSFFRTMPALEHTLAYTCSKCGHKNETLLRGLASFFT
jgi:hypothetical protein